MGEFSRVFRSVSIVQRLGIKIKRCCWRYRVEEKVGNPGAYGVDLGEHLYGHGWQ
jgi:hypothetical protein